MSAPLEQLTTVAQGIAGFALHALWQAPLLAGATWLAVRVGRPHVRTAHVLWTATLALCVLVPVAATVAGRHAALEARREAKVSITYSALDTIGPLPALHRDPAWKRMLHRHINGNGVQPFSFELEPRTAGIITGLYLLVAGFFLVRLLQSWRRSGALVREASAGHLPLHVAVALRRKCDQLRIEEPPVGMSAEIKGPALAGVLHPTLLLPADSAAQMTATEIDAVLAHELAHLRRRDPVMHAASSLLLVPVAFHPAALWVAKRVRQTREMACDADAAEQMGSPAQYAHALLQVAERTGSGPGRFNGSTTFKTKFFLTGLGFLGTSLELFGAGGAMEERMETLMKTKNGKGHKVLRAGIGLSLGAVAVMAAAMVQIQPALADERGPQEQTPHLISGDHARDQLRDARRQLDAAAAKATTDEDRRKIATARAITSAAEQQIAAASGLGKRTVRLNGMDKLGPMQFDFKGLDTIHVDPKIDMKALQLQMDDLHVKFDSPEFKARMEDARRHAEEARKQFDTPEFRAQIEKARSEAEAARMKFDSPEFKAQMEDARRQAEEARKQFDTPEFRAQIQKQMEAAKISQKEAMKQIQIAKIDRGEIERVMERAREAQAEAIKNFRIQMNSNENHPGQIVARVEGPKDIEPAFAGKDQTAPMKVPGKVLAGNVLTKMNPVYPPEAKEKHISGAVVLHVLVSEDGKVEQVSVVNSPDPLLSKASVDAVQQWTYKPYLLNGKPTAVDSTVTVTFSFAD